MGPIFFGKLVESFWQDQKSIFLIATSPYYRVHFPGESPSILWKFLPIASGHGWRLWAQRGWRSAKDLSTSERWRSGTGWFLTHPQLAYICIPYIYIHIHMYLHEFAYGPKTEVAKRYFFVAEVLDATLMMGWGGVGWGMLTFVWTCWGSWCYADDGVGWGGVGDANVRVNLLRFLMLRWWWGGVGWGGGC